MNNETIYLYDEYRFKLLNGIWYQGLIGVKKDKSGEYHTFPKWSKCFFKQSHWCECMVKLGKFVQVN